MVPYNVHLATNALSSRIAEWYTKCKGITQLCYNTYMLQGKNDSYYRRYLKILALRPKLVHRKGKIIFIAKRFNISQQRVRQILANPPISVVELNLKNQNKEEKPHPRIHIYNCVLCGGSIYSPSARRRTFCGVCLDKYLILRRGGGNDKVRMLARIRDGFTCQACHKKRGLDEVKKSKLKLFDVHHLNGLCGRKNRERGNDRIADIPGLITLCHKCHFNRHDFSKKGKLASRQ